MPEGPQHRVCRGTHGSSSALGNSLRSSGEGKKPLLVKNHSRPRAQFSVIKSKPRHNTRDESPSRHGATESPEMCAETGTRGARGKAAPRERVSRSTVLTWGEAN